MYEKIGKKSFVKTICHGSLPNYLCCKALDQSRERASRSPSPISSFCISVQCGVGAADTAFPGLCASSPPDGPSRLSRWSCTSPAAFTTPTTGLPPRFTWLHFMSRMAAISLVRTSSLFLLCGQICKMYFVLKATGGLILHRILFTTSKWCRGKCSL